MSKKILIIEDEQTIAELEKDYLEIDGFFVEIASTGLEGIEKAEKEQYDLIILDLMLPGMNGFEICKRIRERQNVPILMVSAKKEDIDKIRGLGLGADDYITKPFSPSELVARVKAHLNRYERLVGTMETKAELVIKNMTINSEARRVCIDGKEVVLTVKEYDLLYFLASNPDHVFSKEILLDRIWGIEHYGDTATVTVHVGKLRDKIDKASHHGKTEFIETVWGAGYRFKV